MSSGSNIDSEGFETPKPGSVSSSTLFCKLFDICWVIGLLPACGPQPCVLVCLHASKRSALYQRFPTLVYHACRVTHLALHREATPQWTPRPATWVESPGATQGPRLKVQRSSTVQVRPVNFQLPGITGSGAHNDSRSNVHEALTLLCLCKVLL